MNPWSIIGWLALGIIITAIVVAIFRNLAPMVTCAVRHYLTRRVPPREGQVWMSCSGQEYWVEQRWPAGHFTVSCPHPFGTTSIGLTDEEWADLVDRNWMYLLEEDEA